MSLAVIRWRAIERREQRGLTVIVVALLALGTLVALFLRPAAVSSPVPRPDLLSNMDWISHREGWLSLFDRPGGRTELLHTTDAGAHWSRERVANALETVSFVDPAQGFLSSQDAPGQSARPSGAVTAYRTGDGGRHWRRLTLPAGVVAGRLSFADALHGWAWDASRPGLYATGDGGGHWRRVDASGLPDLGPVPGTFGFRDGAHGWAALPAAQGAPVLYATSDGGESWAALPLPAPGESWQAGSRFEVGPAAIAPDGHGQLLVSELVPWGFRQVVVSHWVAATADAGATWSPPQRLPDAPPGTVVSISASRVDGSVSWAWSRNELSTTRDAGGHWTALAVPPGWSIDRVQAIDATTAWVAASTADRRGNGRWRLFSTRDAGSSWTESALPSLR